jgi:hypothetical protein
MFSHNLSGLFFFDFGDKVAELSIMIIRSGAFVTFWAFIQFNTIVILTVVPLFSCLSRQ